MYGGSPTRNSKRYTLQTDGDFSWGSNSAAARNRVCGSDGIAAACQLRWMFCPRDDEQPEEYALIECTFASGHKEYWKSAELPVPQSGEFPILGKLPGVIPGGESASKDPEGLQNESESTESSNTYYYPGIKSDGMWRNHMPDTWRALLARVIVHMALWVGRETLCYRGTPEVRMNADTHPCQTAESRGNSRRSALTTHGNPGKWGAKPRLQQAAAKERNEARRKFLRLEPGAAFRDDGETFNRTADWSYHDVVAHLCVTIRTSFVFTRLAHRGLGSANLHRWHLDGGEGEISIIGRSDRSCGILGGNISDILRATSDSAVISGQSPIDDRKSTR
ncbi:hypothetical protein EDC04DRAFT_2610486 [Pisolithus marmoratus]|nr:hypothetical protein EDC04DRAFT_2610486 [Pisolithus marmoratus]